MDVTVSTADTTVCTTNVYFIVEDDTPLADGTETGTLNDVYVIEGSSGGTWTYPSGTFIDNDYGTAGDFTVTTRALPPWLTFTPAT